MTADGVPTGLAMAAGVQVTVRATQNPLPQAMAPKLEADLDRIHRQRADPTDASPGSASCATVNKVRLAFSENLGDRCGDATC
jgi:hypothetical protein